MSAEHSHIKVLLVDDHALFCEGVAEIFAAQDDIKVVGQAQNGLEAVDLAETHKPDVVLLDVEMPLMGAEEAIGEILRVAPSSRVLVLSMHDEPRLIRRLLHSGACAYITKNATGDELVAVVRTVHWDEDRVILSASRRTVERLEGSENSMLTARELEVLVLTARAMSTSQIASHLYITQGTVKRHLTHVYAKLDVSCRTNAVNKALKSGLVTFRDISESA